MSKSKKKSDSVTELYYEMNVDKLVIHVYKGGSVKILTGQAPPPPKPGGH